MLRNEILNATTPTEVFGTIIDKDELALSAARLKNLFKAQDPDRVAAHEKIDQLLKERSYPIAKIEDGAARTRKSPYRVGAVLSTQDGFVSHASINKRNIVVALTFPNRVALNTTVVHMNDMIEQLRKSVTKRNRVNFPEVVDTFYMKHRTGAEILTTVHANGEGPTLNKLQGSTFSDAQIAHIYREMLETLRKTHAAGIIHGGCYLNAWTWDLPSNQLVLKDWQYSIHAGERSTLLPSALVDQGLIVAKQADTRTLKAETDIRLASLAAFNLTNESNSPWMRKYLHSQAQYTHSEAKQVMKEFTELFRNKQGIEPEPLNPSTYTPNVKP